MGWLETLFGVIVLVAVLGVIALTLLGLVLLIRQPACPLCRAKIWFNPTSGRCKRCELRLSDYYGQLPPTKLIADHDLHWTAEAGWHRERALEPSRYECAGCMQRDFGWAFGFAPKPEGVWLANAPARSAFLTTMLARPDAHRATIEAPLVENWSSRE